MCLSADLFLQAWRPSAFAVGGIVNWAGLFLIGMLFPYIVVRTSYLLHSCVNVLSCVSVCVTYCTMRSSVQKLKVFLQ